MYFGLGENLGADYKLIGSDGVTLAGGGEGGTGEGKEQGDGEQAGADGRHDGVLGQGGGGKTAVVRVTVYSTGAGRAKVARAGLV
jgi:hypothetical protein